MFISQDYFIKKVVLAAFYINNIVNVVAVLWKNGSFVER